MRALWVKRNPFKPEQISECVGAAAILEFTDAEMAAIDEFAAKPGQTL